MARVEQVGDRIYRISSFTPQKRLSFNQFLIDDERRALIHTGTYPMYDDVRSASAQVLDPCGNGTRPGAAGRAGPLLRRSRQPAGMPAAPPRLRGCAERGAS